MSCCVVHLEILKSWSLTIVSTTAIVLMNIQLSTPEEIETYAALHTNPNTEKNSEWSLNTYNKWARGHNLLCPADQIPMDFNQVTPLRANFILCKFLVEVKNTKNEDYSYKTLYCLVVGLNRKFKRNWIDVAAQYDLLEYPPRQYRQFYQVFDEEPSEWGPEWDSDDFPGPEHTNGKAVFSLNMRSATNLSPMKRPAGMRHGNFVPVPRGTKSKPRRLRLDTPTRVDLLFITVIVMLVLNLGFFIYNMAQNVNVQIWTLTYFLATSLLHIKFLILTTTSSRDENFLIL